MAAAVSSLAWTVVRRTSQALGWVMLFGFFAVGLLSWKYGSPSIEKAVPEALRFVWSGEMVLGSLLVGLGLLTRRTSPLLFGQAILAAAYLVWALAVLVTSDAVTVGGALLIIVAALSAWFFDVLWRSRDDAQPSSRCRKHGLEERRHHVDRGDRVDRGGVDREVDGRLGAETSR